MMKLLPAAALTAAVLSLGACATVTRGEHTAWEVRTSPPGAQVKTSNGMICDSTPCSLRMMRKDKFTATITKPGYKTVEIKVTNKISGQGGLGLAGNVIIGGVIGLGVDAVTGASLDLTPNPVDLVLEKYEPVAAPMAALAPEAAAPMAAAPAAAAPTAAKSATTSAPK
jgi:hypothetical protein